MQTYSITFGQSEKQTNWPDYQKLTWEQIRQRLTDHKEGEKSGKCFLPVKLKGTSRKANEVEEVSMLVFDIDDGTPLAEIEGLMSAKKLSAIIYSSHSHMQPKGKDDIALPRYRICVPLTNPFRFDKHSPQDWKNLYLATAAWIGLNVDTNCCDASRLYYLPRHKKGAKYITKVLDGIMFDPEIEAFVGQTFPNGVPTKAEQQTRTKLPLQYLNDKPDSTRLLNAIEALMVIDADCPYDEWIAVGRALKSGFNDHGFYLWSFWSSFGEKYKPSEMLYKWESF